MPLDTLLRQAWHTTVPRLLADPDELRRRLARRRTPAVTDPPRAWCLVVRASDTRISPWQTILCPEHATDPDSEYHPGRVVAHEMHLTADVIRRLCQPVWLDPAGVTMPQAAAALGCHRETLRNAVRRGIFQVRHVPQPGRPRGRPVPILHHPGPLDPAAANLRQPPDPVWGSLWQHLAHRVPDHFEQVVHRTPVYHPYPRTPRALSNPAPPQSPPLQGWAARDIPSPPPQPSSGGGGTSGGTSGGNPGGGGGGGGRFRGYRFACPACRKAVRQLYLPLPVLNLLHHLPLPEPEADAERSEASGHSQKPNADSPQARNRRDLLAAARASNDPTHPDALQPPPLTFACLHCHRVRYFTRANRNSWNIFIAHLTAGLLYGHEVPQPPWFTPTRKRARTTPPRDNTPQ